MSFKDFTNGAIASSDPWMDQEAVDEVLRCAPVSERKRLEKLFVDRTCCPDLCNLVAGLARTLDKPVRWPSAENRKVFARAAESVIRHCLGSASALACGRVTVRDRAPVPIALRTAALVEILMAGAQERAPLWERRLSDLPSKDASFADIRAVDQFFSDLDDDPPLELGPDPKDSILVVERKLYARIHGDAEIYEPAKHRATLQGELRALSDMGRRLYARVDASRKHIHWGDVSEAIGGVTILIVTHGGVEVAVEEEELAALLRRFYVDCAPELLHAPSSRAKDPQ